MDIFGVLENWNSRFRTFTVTVKKNCQVKKQQKSFFLKVSEKWRIALDYQDDDTSNGDVSKSDIIVTPKSLVSVVRIDSYYNPKLIPKIQVCN